VNPEDERLSAADVIALHSICECGQYAENIEEHAAHIIDELSKAHYVVVYVPPYDRPRRQRPVDES
jgi:hypothetical protein